MKITVNRKGAYKGLGHYTPISAGSWFIRDDANAICVVLQSNYVVMFYVIGIVPQMLTVGTVEGKWTPCEVNLEVN